MLEKAANQAWVPCELGYLLGLVQSTPFLETQAPQYSFTESSLQPPALFFLLLGPATHGSPKSPRLPLWPSSACTFCSFTRVCGRTHTRARARATWRTYSESSHSALLERKSLSVGMILYLLRSCKDRVPCTLHPGSQYTSIFHNHAFCQTEQ